MNNSLAARALIGFIKRVILFGLLLFLTARWLDFWEAWAFLFTFFIPQLLIVAYFLKKDPELIERRMKGGPSAETRTNQKIIIALIQFVVVLSVLVSALDHRFHGSRVPAFLVITADVVILLGLLIQFYVFRENSFASAFIAIVPKQKVISTGPYAMVRHPMYSGILLVNSFIPIALGSWWGLTVALAMPVVLALRLLDEEKLLRQSLPGYEEYCQKVPYRLIPCIW